ncbi:MAG: hypothetical protein NTU97_00970 [Candidatus Magasanikbacteria bacterium]|nr:hypothetical protein [Candidatus Magasanikbacteria bacterium]
MYSLGNFFTTQYWFGQTPFLGKPALWAMVIIFGVMLVGGVIINTLAKGQKYGKPLSRGLSKIARMLGVMGFFAFVLFFFRYEFVAILSRRFMFGLWFVGLVVWVVFIIKYFIKVVPKQMADKREQERLKKYLP